MMLHAYFDDSGKFGNSDFVCLAGYIATDEHWNGFCEEWQGLLLRHGIPFIHMKHLIPLKGPYESLGWNADHRDEVLQEFIDVIRKHVACGFAVAVDAKYLRSMSKDARAVIGDPALLCFGRIMLHVVAKLKAAEYAPSIAAVFDDCEEYSVRCYRLWSNLRRVNPELGRQIPSIAFADDAVFQPLQAADILAWESNKHLRQMAGKHEVRKQLEWLMQSISPGYGLEYVSELYDVQHLEYLAKNSTELERKVYGRK